MAEGKGMKATKETQPSARDDSIVVVMFTNASKTAEGLAGETPSKMNVIVAHFKCTLSCSASLSGI